MSNPNPLLPQWDAPPAKASTRWKWVLGTLGCVVVLMIGLSAFDWGSSSSSTTRNTATPANVTPAGPVDPLTTNGMYRVGDEIAPGEYSFAVRDGESGYYARCADPNCQPGTDEMIANRTVEGTGYLEIEPTDVYVTLRGLDLTPGGR